MKKTKAFIFALLLSVSSLFVFVPQAFAATRTWDGGGSDNNMTTAANWSTDVAPVAGDNLVFPTGVAEADRAVVNDFAAATSFNSITFSGSAASNADYDFSGNSMTLVAGITNSMTTTSSDIGQTIGFNIILNGNQTFNGDTGGIDIQGTLNLSSNTLTFDTGTSTSSVNGVISGTGALTKTDTGTLILRGDNTYSGATTVSAGLMVIGHHNGLGTAAGGTTVATDAALYFYRASGDVTYDEPLTLSGSGLAGFAPTLGVAISYGSGGGATVPFPLSTFSGAITLQSNITVGGANRNGKITGAISGNYSISLFGSYNGSFEIASSTNNSATANTSLEPAAVTNTFAENLPDTDIFVDTNETAIVTGTYGNVTINTGGTLKGTGTVADVTSVGTIAPGLSPGCLATGNLDLEDGSAYDFELGGKTACTEYDQIRTTGTVHAGGTLNVLLYNNFKPTAGQKYVIVSNDGSDAVTGTFSGLAEGATITVSSYSLKISYVGGDGNDIELTVLVGAPDTGFGLLKNNPMITLAIVTLSASGLLLIARRVRHMAVRK